jgi:putative ABC transport system permease protein
MTSPLVSARIERLASSGQGRRSWALAGLTWLRAVAACQGQNVLTALVQIWANKARAALTALGIIIAVSATIVVVSMVQGFGSHVTNMLRDFGTNLIFVVPDRPPGLEGRRLGRVDLDLNDVRAVAGNCDRVRRISPLIFGQATVEYGRYKLQPGDLELSGATEQFQTIRNFEIHRGRFFSPMEVDTGAYVCAVGSDLLRLLHCDESIIGQSLYINGLRFQVLGVLKAKGQLMGESEDRTLVMPYTTALKLFPFSRYFMACIIEAEAEDKVEDCALQVTRVLRAQHHLQPGQPNDFRLFRQDEFLRDFERVKIIATSVMGCLVGISLIVGGIGIMNIMLVSVTERTREIGLRKSVGGRRRDVLMQFLTEAAVLSSIGGLVGVLLGYGICNMASLHPSMVPIRVPLWIVGVALCFSAAVGLFFGLIPAFKAAILHPIDALRYE